MITFICLFFPAVISIWLYEIISKKQYDFKNIVYRYCLNNVLINFLVFAIKTFVLDTGLNTLQTLAHDMTPSAALNYLLISVPCAVLLAFVEFLLHKNAKLSVEENKDEK